MASLRWRRENFAGELPFKVASMLMSKLRCKTSVSAGFVWFVLRDYTYDSMLLYRNSIHSSVVVAASAMRYASLFERVLDSLCVPSRHQGIFNVGEQFRYRPDLPLLYSQLLASMHSI